MNKSQSSGYSPMRAKRRQSDAKWRASVATCYDALKYVVPNVQNLSKRKISKALILQESEKHIKDLEAAISNMLSVECESKGKEILWKEGVSWSNCTLEKLRADFSDQQRKVFHTATHGRRCYNLLHDIKEDVFNMRADPSRLAFVLEVDRESKEKYKFPAENKDTCVQGFSLGGQHLSQNLDVHFKDGIVKKESQSSSNVDYTCLLQALEPDKEQEVPDLSTVIKPVRQKYSKLHINFPPGELVKEEITDQNKGSIGIQSDKFEPYEVVVGYCDNQYNPNKKGRRVSTLLSSFSIKNEKAETNTNMLSSPDDIVVMNIKKEVIKHVAPMTDRDPLLSSTHTPKLQRKQPLVSNFDTDLLLKRPEKFGSARKKLNFNINPQLGTNSDSIIQSPDRVLFSSPSSGFTPVKLPDDISSDINNALDSFVSPWKALNSPFDLRSESQIFHHSSTTSLDDSLLCFESIDSADLEDSVKEEFTPERQSISTKHDTDDRNKRKMSLRSPSSHKQQPKCRRRLERFYEQVDTEVNNKTDSDNTHVVPQLDAELSNTSVDMDWEAKLIDTPLKENTDDVLGCSDFDGFYFYYCQVSQQLKEKSELVPPSALAAKVADMWSKLSDQDKSTLATLVNLELTESDDSLKLSQDLEDVLVEPLDPQELIQSLDV